MMPYNMLCVSRSYVILYSTFQQARALPPTPQPTPPPLRRARLFMSSSVYCSSSPVDTAMAASSSAPLISVAGVCATYFWMYLFLLKLDVPGQERATYWWKHRLYCLLNSLKALVKRAPRVHLLEVGRSATKALMQPQSSWRCTSSWEALCSAWRPQWLENMWNSFMDIGAKFLKSDKLLHGSWSKVPEFLKKCVQI